MEESNSLILGVCDRLAHDTGLNVWIFRLIFILLLGHGGFIIYILLSLLI